MKSPALFNLASILAVLLGVIGTVKLMAATDFPVDVIIYREGARAFLEGRSVYSEPMYAGDIALPFIYPPFGALVLTPLALAGSLSDDTVGNIVIGISAALLAVCMWFVMRAVAGRALNRPQLLALTAVAWGAAIWFEPFRLNSMFSQINVIVMALVVLDLVPRRRWLPQGTLIGLAAAIKITPLVMLLYFLLRRDIRAIITAGVSGFLACVVAALVRWDATKEFFGTTLLGMGTKSDFGVSTTYQSNSSIKGMIMRFFASEDAVDAHSTAVNVLWLVLSLATIAAGAWLMCAMFKRGMLVDAALTNAVVMLLISPVSWSHHWVWLTLILPVAAWRCATVLRWPPLLTALVALWGVVVLTTPPKWWFGDDIDVHGLAVWQKILVSDYVWLGVALLAVWAVALKRVPHEKAGAHDKPRPVTAAQTF